MNIEKIKAAGIDYDAGVRRFCGNAEKYERYLLKFFDDTTFADLHQSLTAARYDEAFNQAHTLKGVLGNLSIDVLYRRMCEVTELLRTHRTDDLAEKMAECEASYRSVEDAVRSTD